MFCILDPVEHAKLQGCVGGSFRNFLLLQISGGYGVIVFLQWLELTANKTLYYCWITLRQVSL